MIDYYYELEPGTKFLGQEAKYLVRYDFDPTHALSWEFHWHDSALKVSSRVWLQNSNGISLVKGPQGRLLAEPIDEHEFVWIKLQAQDMEQL